MKRLYTAIYEPKDKLGVEKKFLEYGPDTAAKLLAEQLVLDGLFPRKDIAIKVFWVEDEMIYAENFLVDVSIDPFGSTRPA